MIKTKTKHKKEQSQNPCPCSLSTSWLFLRLRFFICERKESPKLGQLLQNHDWHNHQVVEVTGALEEITAAELSRESLSHFLSFNLWSVLYNVAANQILFEKIVSLQTLLPRSLKTINSNYKILSFLIKIAITLINNKNNLNNYSRNHDAVHCSLDSSFLTACLWFHYFFGLYFITLHTEHLEWW